MPDQVQEGNPNSFSKELTAADLSSIGLEPQPQSSEDDSLLTAQEAVAESEESEDLSEEESDDAQDALASDSDDEDLEIDEETEDDLEDEDEELSATDSKTVKAAEKQMRSFQAKYDAEKARNDNLTNQFDDLLQTFNQFKQQAPVDQEVDLSALEDALGADDDLVYVKDVIKQVGSTMKPSEDGKAKQNFEMEEQNRNVWLNRQPEIEKVRSIVNAMTQADSSKLSSVPTDSVGLFHVLKNQILQKQIADMKKAHKLALKKAGSKGRIPPTNGSGRIHRAKSNGSQMGAMETMFANFGDKIGRDLNARAQR